MTTFLRRSVFAFVLGAALTAAVLVGRSRFRDDGHDQCVLQAVERHALPARRGRSECQPNDIPISWNTAGVNGQDGVSVTSQTLAAGADPACPSGGSKFTAANGVSYACNGHERENGQPNGTQRDRMARTARTGTERRQRDEPGARAG